MDLPQRKQALRQTMKTVLQTLSHDEKREAGNAVCSHVQKWLDQHQPDAISVALFDSFADEISTHAINNMVLTRGMHRVTARSDGFCVDTHTTPLNNAASLGLDIIFMPGLAFDSFGGRLGRGKGFFDRALATMSSWPKRPLLVGLVLDEQVIDEVPRASHDITLDYLCTPRHGMVRVSKRRESHA